MTGGAPSDALWPGSTYFLLIWLSSTTMPQKGAVVLIVAFLITVIFIVISYAALDASCARAISADSKLGLWHVGLFMSPSSVCDATRHPPAHTGMNAQSLHSFHGWRRSKRSRSFSRFSSRRPSMWPVENPFSL